MEEESRRSAIAIAIAIFFSFLGLKLWKKFVSMGGMVCLLRFLFVALGEGELLVVESQILKFVGSKSFSFRLTSQTSDPSLKPNIFCLSNE